MMRQSRNRYLEMFLIGASSSPFEVAKFALRTAAGSRRACRLNFRGVSILVRPNTPDIRVVRTSFLGEFEPALGFVSERHGVIIDAGGYIGTAAMIFASKFPRSRVVSLEPNFENFLLARQNCAPFPNIEVLNCALGASTGTVNLKDRGLGPWGFTIVEQPADASGVTDLGEVPRLAMDDLLRCIGADGVDLLKLDIEGAEYELLKDRPEWVKRCGVIVAELHERICPGATHAFMTAMAGRALAPANGEKIISVSRDARTALEAADHSTA